VYRYKQWLIAAALSVASVLLVGGWFYGSEVIAWEGLIAALVMCGFLIREQHIFKQKIDALRLVDGQSQQKVEAAQQRADQAHQQQGELQVQARVAEAQKRKLETILNVFNEAVLVTDAFNEVTHANDAASRLLSLTDQAIHARPIDEVMDDAQLVKIIKDAREGGKTLRKHIEHRMEVNGHHGVYDVALSVFGDTSNPSSDGVVTIFRDVTKQKEIETMKSDFVSQASHELCTPLASIRAYMEMLIDGEATDEDSRNEFYQIIQSEVDRLSRLIDSMLNLNRLEAGLATVHREPIVLPQLIHEAITILRPQALDKKIELIEHPSPVICSVMADRDMILQVIVNLIGNALKYTPEGGRIIVSSEPYCDDHACDTGRVSVSVKDSGIGIPEADIPRLFDPFFRGDTGRRFSWGTGLGLSMVRRVVEDVHHGCIDVKSTVDEGSVFTFTLPIAEKT